VRNGANIVETQGRTRGGWGAGRRYGHNQTKTPSRRGREWEVKASRTPSRWPPTARGSRDRSLAKEPTVRAPKRAGARQWVRAVKKTKPDGVSGSGARVEEQTRRAGKKDRIPTRVDREEEVPATGSGESQGPGPHNVANWASHGGHVRAPKEGRRIGANAGGGGGGGTV